VSEFSVVRRGPDFTAETVAGGDAYVAGTVAAEVTTEAAVVRRYTANSCQGSVPSSKRSTEY
jgi:hypothetical protein